MFWKYCSFESTFHERYNTDYVLWETRYENLLLISLGRKAPGNIKGKISLFLQYSREEEHLLLKKLKIIMAILYIECKYHKDEGS